MKNKVCVLSIEDCPYPDERYRPLVFSSVRIAKKYARFFGKGWRFKFSETEVRDNANPVEIFEDRESWKLKSAELFKQLKLDSERKENLAAFNRGVYKGYLEGMQKKAEDVVSELRMEYRRLAGEIGPLEPPMLHVHFVTKKRKKAKV